MTLNNFDDDLFTEHQGFSSAGRLGELCKNYPRHARLKSYYLPLHRVHEENITGDLNKCQEAWVHNNDHPKYTAETSIA